MANPSKKKGTEYEVFVLEKILRPIWPHAVRVSNTLGRNDRGDFFSGTDSWVVEAKKWDAWALPAWIRVVRKKAGSRPWCIITAQDRRKLPGDYVVMPAQQWSDMMRELSVLRALTRKV